MFDYENLRFFTWAIVGVLLIGFTITDGFDMGVAALLPVLGKTNSQRRVMINSIAPHWDGNQVWLITAGGAIFAIWPAIYGAAFSGFYIAMLLALATLWFRPVGMDYRAKIDDPRWRAYCDWLLIASGIIPPVIFGVGFGNVLIGAPFQFNELLMMDYQGGFFSLLTWFPLLCGVISLMMMVTQGAAFLQLKTTGSLKDRTQKIGGLCAAATAVLFVLGGIYAIFLPGYIVTSDYSWDMLSNPLLKEVVKQDGMMLHNFLDVPALWIIPGLGVLTMLWSAVTLFTNRGKSAFVASSIGIACIILTAGVALFPLIMPSSLNPSHSLALFDSTSSEHTLRIISIVAILVVPVVLAYTAWSYYKMFGRLDEKYVEDNSSSLY